MFESDWEFLAYVVIAAGVFIGTLLAFVTL